MSASIGNCALPSGNNFDPYRRRSMGALDAEELQYCRDNGIPLAYDPVQQGMVALTCLDDITFGSNTSTTVAQPTRIAVEQLQRREPPQPLQDVWIVGDGPYRLRPLSSKDIARYVELLGDPEVWQYLPEDYPGTMTEDLAASLIELSNSREDHVVRAIEIDGLVVGQVRLLFNDAGPTHSTAEVSYWLGRAYWGQGIASQIVPGFTRECFARFTDLESIIARVHRDNIGSARVIQRAQYLVTGVAGNTVDWQIFETRRASHTAPAHQPNPAPLETGIAA